MNCIICDKKKFKEISSRVRDSNSHKIKCCTNCGHCQLYPIPTTKEEEIFYDENRQAKNINVKYEIPILRERSKFDTKRRIKLVSKLISKKGKILEIGSGYGFFLEGLFKKNYDLIGLELSKTRIKI